MCFLCAFCIILYIPPLPRHLFWPIQTMYSTVWDWALQKHITTLKSCVSREGCDSACNGHVSPLPFLCHQTVVTQWDTTQWILRLRCQNLAWKLRLKAHFQNTNEFVRGFWELGEDIRFREEQHNLSPQLTRRAQSAQKGRPAFLVTMWDFWRVHEDTRHTPQWFCAT